MLYNFQSDSMKGVWVMTKNVKKKKKNCVNFKMLITPFTKFSL